MKKRRYRIVAEMMCDGYSRRAIAEHLGIKVTSVHNHIKYARSIGVEARFDKGRILLASAPPYIERWLREQAPEGATAGDMILAILNDAYNEEMQNG
jgi:transposase